MKKLLSFCLLTGFLFLVSCGDDDENVSTDCKLTSADGFDGDGTFSLNYGSDGRLTSLGATFDDDGVQITLTYTASYTGGNLTRLALPGDAQVISFTYDNSARIVRVDITSDGFVERTMYVYNSSGQVTRVNYSYSPEAGIFVEESYTTYQYANTTTRNPSSATEFFYDGSIAFEEGTSVFQYDDKRSFVSASPVLAAIFGFFSENNVTRETYTGEFGDSYVGTFTYQYNAQGYPTSITEQYDNDDPNIVTLTYDCR